MLDYGVIDSALIIRNKSGTISISQDFVICGNVNKIAIELMDYIMDISAGNRDYGWYVNTFYKTIFSSELKYIGENCMDDLLQIRIYKNPFAFEISWTGNPSCDWDNFEKAVRKYIKLKTFW